jgi:purine nucleosidase
MFELPASDISPRKRLPVVVDTDLGVDDATALIYLAADPRVELVAIGSVHGNVPATVAARNALRVVELIDLSHVPVAVGADRTLNGAEPDPVFSGQGIHGEDGLGGQAGAPPRGAAVPEHAAQQLVRLARARTGMLTVVALGPLTNVALALHLEPELPRLLRRLVWMGGAIDVAGNIGPEAEANSWHDPEAVEMVLRAGFPLTMVPLDATQYAVVDGIWLDTLAASAVPVAERLLAWMSQYVSVHSQVLGHRGCVLHDVVAAAVAIDPNLVIRAEELEVVCVTGSDLVRGATKVDRRELPFGLQYQSRKPVIVVKEADSATILHSLQRAMLSESTCDKAAITASPRSAPPYP